MHHLKSYQTVQDTKTSRIIDFNSWILIIPYKNTRYAFFPPSFLEWNKLIKVYPERVADRKGEHLTEIGMAVEKLLVDYISKLPVCFAKLAESGLGEVFSHIFDGGTSSCTANNREGWTASVHCLFTFSWLAVSWPCIMYAKTIWNNYAHEWCDFLCCKFWGKQKTNALQTLVWVSLCMFWARWCPQDKAWTNIQQHMSR